MSRIVFHLLLITFFFYLVLDENILIIMGYIADHHDNLLATLTDKQKEILEKFDDCYAELTDINEREIFVYAFRLGARIAIEVFSPGSEA